MAQWTYLKNQTHEYYRVVNSLQPSYNQLLFLDIISDFRWMERKRKGSRTDPCGTPLEIVKNLEIFLPDNY